MEYKDSDEGTSWTPELVRIPGEHERFDAMCEAVAADVLARWEAKGEIADTPDFPEQYELSSARSSGKARLTNGRRFPVPDKPFKAQFVHEQTESLVDIVDTTFGVGLSQKVIDMIESIEPSVHQYLPFEFLNPDGSTYHEKRRLLNITTREETVRTEESNVAWSPVNEYVPRRFGDITVNGGKRHTIIDHQKAAGRALWVEWRYRAVPSGLGFMVSDRLWTMLQNAGVRGWSTEFTSCPHMEER